MTIVLISSCVITPYRIAFGPIIDDPTWTAISYSIDTLFFLDMLAMFNIAYYDEQLLFIIVNRHAYYCYYQQELYMILEDSPSKLPLQ